MTGLNWFLRLDYLWVLSRLVRVPWRQLWLVIIVVMVRIRNVVRKTLSSVTWSTANVNLLNASRTFVTVLTSAEWDSWCVSWTAVVMSSDLNIMVVTC